jgi:hypothetical protein
MEASQLPACRLSLESLVNVVNSTLLARYTIRPVLGKSLTAFPGQLAKNDDGDEKCHVVVTIQSNIQPRTALSPLGSFWIVCYHLLDQLHPLPSSPADHSPTIIFLSEYE